MRNSANNEFTQMSNKIGWMAALSVTETPDVALTMLSGGMTSITKSAFKESESGLRYFTEQVLMKPFELLEHLLGMKLTQSQDDLQLDAKEILYSWTEDDRETIAIRGNEFTDFIEATPANLDINGINNIAEDGMDSIEAVSQTSQIIDIPNLDPEVEDLLFSMPVSLLPAQGFKYYTYSIDDWTKEVKFIDDWKDPLRNVFLVLVVAILLIIAVLTLAGSGGTALVPGLWAVLYSNGTALIGVLLGAGPGIAMTLMTILAMLTFQIAAVPDIVDQNDQTLDILEAYIQDSASSQASVSQIECSSLGENEVSVKTTLDSYSSEPVVNKVYSPDGRLIGMSMDKGTSPRINSTTTISMYDYGMYTVSSSTFKDFDENNVQTASVTYDPVEVICNVRTNKNIYSEGEAVVLSAEFVNKGSTDLIGMPYYIGVTDLKFNETGTLDIAANSSTLTDLTFSAPENGSYTGTAILYSGFVPLAESETAFVVGNGSSVALNIDVQDFFEAGTVPAANITLQCAGDEYVDTMVIRTSSVTDEIPVYENITEYSISANSTMEIQTNVLNSSTPGVYITQISYGDSFVNKRFVIEAEDTVFITPITNEMIYDTDELVQINTTCKNQTNSFTDCDFEIEHLYPNGSIEVLSKTEVATGNYLTNLNTNVNGTHHIRTVSESDTKRIYTRDSFFIVSTRSSPTVNQVYFSNNTSIVALQVTNEEDIPIGKTSVSLNNSTSFTDRMGYATFFENGTSNITVEIKKPGYASYYGEYEFLNFTEDSTSPNVEITSLQENAVYRDTIIRLSGNLEDNIHVKNAYYVINNASWHSMTFDENGRFDILIEDSQLNYGGNNLTVIASDLCGNENDSIVNFTLKETTPSEITIISPQDGGTYHSFPEINVTTDEEATIIYSLNTHNETNVTQLEQYMIAGENNLIVYATDLDGYNASKEITFNYVVCVDVEVITNGGFESGNTTNWAIDSGGAGYYQTHEIAVAPDHNYSGSYGCEIYVGSFCLSNSYLSMSQNIDLTNVSNLTFNHRRTYLEDVGPGSSRFEFYIDDNMTIIPYSDTWKQETIDVSNYTGMHDIKLRVYSESPIQPSEHDVKVEIDGISALSTNDWNPWNDLDSEGLPDGTYITLSEVIDAYNCFRNGTPAPETGVYITSDDVDDMYNAFQNGTPM